MKAVQLGSYGIFRDEDFLRATPVVETNLEIRIEAAPKTANEEFTFAIVKKSDIAIKFFIEDRTNPKVPLEIIEESNQRVTEKKIIRSATDILKILGLDEETLPNKTRAEERITKEQAKAISIRRSMKNTSILSKMMEDHEQLMAALPETSNPEYQNLLSAALKARPSDERLAQAGEWQNEIISNISSTFESKMMDEEFSDSLNKILDNAPGTSDKDQINELLEEVMLTFFGSSILSSDPA